MISRSVSVLSAKSFYVQPTISDQSQLCLAILPKVHWQSHPGWSPTISPCFGSIQDDLQKRLRVIGQILLRASYKFIPKATLLGISSKSPLAMSPCNYCKQVQLLQGGVWVWWPLNPKLWGEGSFGNLKISTGRQVLQAATSLGNMRRPGTGLRNVD